MQSKIKSFLRVFKSNGRYSFVSMSSLVLGLICFVYIFIYISTEFSYDHQHKNKERIYRLGLDVITQNGSEKFPFSSMPFGPTLKQDVPAIENYVRFCRHGGHNFIKKNNDPNYQKIDNLYLVDSSIFSVFTNKLISGDPVSALQNPSSIVLTESISEKMQVKLGDVIVVPGRDDREVLCTVTGIIEDIKENNFLRYQVLVSLSTYPLLHGQEYSDRIKTTHKRPAAYTYVMFKHKVNDDEIHSYFDAYLQNYMNDQPERMTFDINYCKLTDLHFSKGFSEDLPKGNYTSVVILGILGLLVLIVSCINYINIEIAISTKRFKEIAIRKIHGIHKSQVRSEFLLYSIFFTFLSVLISLILVGLLSDFYTGFTGKEFSWELIFNYKFILFAFLLSLVIGLLSGSYTSLYLSKVNPLVALKKSKPSQAKDTLGKMLLLIQLIICFGAVSSTVIISNQFDFLMNKDLGYDSNNTLSILVHEDEVISKYKLIKDELKKEDWVENVSIASQSIDSDDGQWEVFIKEENNLNSYLLFGSIVDEDYIDLNGIDIIEGRNFDKNRKSDESSCIINETMVNKLGWGNDVLNKEIYQHSDGKNPLKVIGVVKDFHFENLNNKIAPFIFMRGEGQRYLNVKYKIEYESIAFEKVQQKLTEYGAILPPEISFVDENLKGKYKGENDFRELFRLFTIIAIFISIIGIIGLTSYKVQRQMRDVAIKKVIGASLYHIFASYIFRIVKLFGISILIGLPLVYYFLRIWLTNYAYRIDISFLHLLSGALLIFFVIIFATAISLSGIIYLDPVKLLKDE
jgi:putative ABC transport system permease protein